MVTITSSQNIGCNHTDCRTTWHKHGVNCWDCSRIWEEKTERKTKKGCFARGNEEETEGRKWAREEEDDWANKTLQGAETPSAHKCSYSKQKRDSCSGMAKISYYIFTYLCISVLLFWNVGHRRLSQTNVKHTFYLLPTLLMPYTVGAYCFCGWHCCANNVDFQAFLAVSKHMTPN